MRQDPYREMDYYQCFANVVADITTLQNFAYAYLGAFLLVHGSSSYTISGVYASIDTYLFHFFLCFPASTPN